jgi:hypothetical protein
MDGLRSRKITIGLFYQEKINHKGTKGHQEEKLGKKKLLGPSSGVRILLRSRA